jgi:hypothetical protein
MEDDTNPLDSTREEKLSEATAIALNLIPVVGGTLAAIAMGFISRRQNRRLQEFLDLLAEDLKTLSERLDIEFVKSNEFEDLAEDILSKASETRQQEKLEALRAIFLNTIIADNPNYNEGLEMAELITRWQPRHITILRILNEPLEADRQMGDVVGFGGGFSTSIGQILSKLLPSWDEDQIDRTWKELNDARIHNTPSTKTMITDQGIHQLQNRLTDFGQKVANYLQNPAR